MAKKKLTQQYEYKKGVRIKNKQEVLDNIKNSDEIHLKQETYYDDGSQSFVIEVHYTSKQ